MTVEEGHAQGDRIVYPSSPLKQGHMMRKRGDHHQAHAAVWIRNVGTKKE